MVGRIKHDDKQSKRVETLLRQRLRISTERQSGSEKHGPNNSPTVARDISTKWWNVLEGHGPNSHRGYMCLIMLVRIAMEDVCMCVFGRRNNQWIRSRACSKRG